MRLVVGAAERGWTDAKPVQFLPQAGQGIVGVEPELAFGDAPERPADPLEFAVTLLVVPDLQWCRGGTRRACLTAISVPAL
ncbi:hypothetical protein [Streptomyces sp. NBC_00019]|uniref:hypothetical protein n=1 Tax=Streptomyces sp. NBC_00019 TaxID=2975623 RepID=UPI00324352FA